MCDEHRFAKEFSAINACANGGTIGDGAQIVEIGQSTPDVATYAYAKLIEVGANPIFASMLDQHYGGTLSRFHEDSVAGRVPEGVNFVPKVA